MGNYKISAEGFDYLNEYKCIQLEDKLTNTFIQLTAQNEYEFTMLNLLDEKRFVLHFNKDKDCKEPVETIEMIVEADNSVEVLPIQGGNILNFNYSENTFVSVSVVNLIGQDIVEKQNFSVQQQSETIQLPDTFSGLYFIKISSDKGNEIKRFYKR
jgi:hypothetical protein